MALCSSDLTVRYRSNGWSLSWNFERDNSHSFFTPYIKPRRKSFPPHFTNFQVLQKPQALQLTKLSTLLSFPNSFLKKFPKDFSKGSGFNTLTCFHKYLSLQTLLFSSANLFGLLSFLENFIRVICVCCRWVGSRT